MPRIPEEEIDRIKRETDLAALVRSRGIELHKHGGNGHLAGKCPFHDEDEASFIVTPAKGLFHCMGCGAAGNAIQFIEKFDGVGFRHAYELLREGSAAFTTSYKTGQVKRTTMRRLENPFKPDAADYQLYDQVVAYYHDRLHKTPAAQEYLRRRGLFDEEAIAAFKIGFSDRTIGMRIPEKQKSDGGIIRERLKKIGIIRENGQEHMAGSIVLPIFDSQGHLAEMYGRKIGGAKLRKGTPMHLYLPGPHAGIWNQTALQEPELILCEAPLDALTFWVNGIRNVTFIYGTEGFPKYLLDALISHHVKTVRLAYDADDAGNRAAARDTDRLSAHGIQVYRVKFPWGMDVNDYALKVSPAAKSLRVAVDSAEWVGGKVDVPAKAPEKPSVCALHTDRPADVPKEPAPESSTHLSACGDAQAGAPAACRAEASRVGGRASSSLAAELAANSGPEPGRRAANEKSESVLSEKPARNASHSDAGGSVVEPPPTLTRQGEYHTLTLGKRQYRVGGLDKSNSLEVLKVAVRVRYEESFHLDSFDMTRDGERRRFIERAAEETGLEKELIKRDLGKLLLALEAAQQERLNAALQSERRNPQSEMTTAERGEALAFLKAPDLVEKIGSAFDAYGLVGEQSKRLAAYLACTSRKLAKPLAVIIQSSTAAGKTALMEAVLAMFPEEERVKYSAMTGQSLFYLGETDLKHKILAIVEEEGAEKAGYALKLLQSEGELTIASTGKNPQTGRMETQEYHVEGPVMIFLTTTAIEIDEELQNRCLVLTVDESREQTERIHALQRKDRTLEGLVMREERKDLLRVLRNAQRLIQPLAVVNPYADELTFTAERTRTRRDNLKYLSLIDAIALLHQHQRRIETREVGGRKVPFIRATLDDIALANKLAPELLGRSLDELPPQTRRLLEYIKTLVRDLCKRDAIEQDLALFGRRQLCQLSGWTYSQVKRHLIRLQELEYIVPRYGRMGAAMRYELLIDANEPADVYHIGLLDVEKLKSRCDSDRDGNPGSETSGLRNSPRSTGSGQATTTATRTPEEGGWTPPCQNEMAKLSAVESTTNDNLATLSARTSGAAAVLPS